MWSEKLLKMVKETSFLKVFEEMEEEPPYGFEDRIFPYQVEDRHGIVCIFVRQRPGKYGPLIDVDLIAIVNLDTEEEVAIDDKVTIPLSRANLRIGIENLGELKTGDKLAIVNLGKTKIKSGKWKGRDCYDYRVKKLEG